MSRSAALLAGLAVVLTPLASARADEPPAYDPCAAAPGALPEQCVVPRSVTEPDYRDLSERTHVSVAPTGNLLAPGEVDLAAHEIYFWRLAFGVTDRFELSASMPIIPIVTNIGGRLALTSRESPLKVVVGLGAWIPMMDDAEPLGQGTITVAYQTENTNVHATATTIKPMGDDDEYVFGYALGVIHKVNQKGALVAELTRFAAVDSCYDCTGYDVDTFHGALVGFKLMGKRTDVDLGLFVALLDEGEDVPALPVLSVNHRW